METWLKCKVSPGQFSVEYAVQAIDFEGKGFSLFAPNETVEVEQEPSHDSSVSGFMLVEIVSGEGNRSLIRLPREAFEIGYYVTVSPNQLEARPSRQEA